MTKVVGYTRVSTNKQADQGFGLEVQADTITRWARAHRVTVVGWYRDTAESGADATRVGLIDALDVVQAGDAQGIVVARLDRLARDLVLQEKLIGDVRRHGGRVHSCTAAEDELLDDDPTEPTRKLIRQILGAIAEHERAVIRMRMEAGRARKIAEGGYAHGAPPYGYRAQDGRLVPEPIEQAQLDLIWTMHTGGASHRVIARFLEQSEAPAPKGGTTWHANTVRRILDRLKRERGTEALVSS